MENNDIAEVLNALESDDLSSAVEKIKKHLEQLGRTELNIAVTGESGSGKSTFINAFRGIGHEEEDSAKTDVVQTTKRPIAYVHPKYKNLKLWDLPGIGTPNFKADEYLTQVNFQSYDFFMINAADRFREYHAQLAAEIVKMNKKFYFVRSKIDANIYAEQRKKTFNKEKTLEAIRADCIKGLEEVGLSNPSVFLISSFDVDQYDFKRLEETMKRELPQYKRHVLTLALPNFIQKVIDTKTKALFRNIWMVATLSVDVLSLPNIKKASISEDSLVKEIQSYYKALGLEKESLERLAECSGKSVDELKSKLKFPLNNEINDDAVNNLLSSESTFALKAATDYWQGLVPGNESLPSGLLSFATVYHMLKNCLNELSENAKNLLMAVLETSV